MSILAPAVAVALMLAGCASVAQRAGRPASPAPSLNASSSMHSGATVPAALQCPVTAPPVQPRAGITIAPLAADPTGALACITDVAASKRAAIGPGTPIPAFVATVLARLIDVAAPADEATAERCAAAEPLLLTRFGYSSGTVDVIVSNLCQARHIVYIDDRGYVLPALLSAFCQLASNPSPPGSRHMSWG